MARDIVNFNAGPAGLPRPALEKAHEELLDFEGTGISIMEHSHRGKAYDAVHQEATALMRALLAVPDTHEVLFLQGGASQLFATIPMNLLTAGRSADYVVTGSWSKKALAEAKLVGSARSAGSGAVDGAFVRIPKAEELELDPSAAYVHITSNNTIAGTQYQSFFDSGSVPLVADMSSDILWRPIDVSKFGLIYAGAQKNIGPSGVVVVIADKQLIASGSDSIPTIFRFKTHAENASLYNTPPTFGIYMIRNVLRWVRDEVGGLEKMEARNREKGAILYGAIDSSDGFYRCPVETASRSFMNVVWRLPSEALEKQFIAEAEAAGLIGLKGHRSVGGCRASTYNAVSVDGVARLAELMKAFKARA
jgi:phosphoserine aminotransferase